MYNGDQCLRQFPLATFTAMLAAHTGAGATDGGWGYGGAFTNSDDPYQGTVNSSTAVPSWWPASNWVRSDIHISAVAIASNALVAVYAKASTMVSTFGGGSTIAVPEAATWYLGVLKKTDGTTIWETQLPNVGTSLKGEPVLEGLAIDRNGYIIVVQRNGNVLCYGGGVVSVADRSPSMDARSGKALPGPVPATRVHLDAAVIAKTGAASQTSPTTPAPRSSVTQVPPSPLLPATLETAAVGPDTSDMITRTDGARVHAYSPSIRAEMVRATVGNPADMTWTPDQPCLNVAAVTASSSAGKANGERNTIDRDLRTRWSPSSAGSQWVTYDLGRVCEVSSVSLVWYASRGGQTMVKIGVSMDGKTYQTVDSGVLDGRGVNETLRSFVSHDARYVRVFINSMSRQSQASLQEVGIHGTADAKSAMAR
jgi:hypothetical protein